VTGIPNPRDFRVLLWKSGTAETWRDFNPAGSFLLETYSSAKETPHCLAFLMYPRSSA
jgi:hypothetical protein